MSPRAVAAALVLASALVHASDVPERVRISTTVTDRQGKPVAGLTTRDFEIREDGVPQSVVAVEARRPAPRRLAILLDEFHVDAADSARVREALDRFTDALRPDDLAAILKPLDPLGSIRLTGDRAALHAAIASFEGRKGNYEPRNPLEEETLGRAPALVDAGRAQVVLSGLRAMTGQLGSAAGRCAILLVSEGFTAQPRRLSVRGLPDAGIVERFANRYDVPIYAFDPRTATADDDPSAVALTRLVTETGGRVSRGQDLFAGLSTAAAEIDGGYTLTYQPSRADDGRYHPVTVTVIRRQADARSRAGYVAPPSAETLRALREAAATGPILSTRLLRRSPLIEVWSGVMRASTGDGRVMVTWKPDPAAAGIRSAAARIDLKATTKDGRVLYEGTLAPTHIGEGLDTVAIDRAEFDAPAGRVQLDMTVLGIGGNKIDVDARDLDVPVMKTSAALLLPAILIATQSARDFRTVVGDADAAPDPSRQFRRTVRLVIRVPAYVDGQPAPVKARLLNRLAQPMRDLPALPETSAGVTQFDLPLAPLAPGEYFLQFNITGPLGPVDQRVAFKITG